MNDRQWIKLMEMGERLGCHQMPERSFTINGYQFPVCARCTGVIVSSFIALGVFFRKKMPVSMCISMSGVMLGDWLLQYMKLKESTNRRRLVTGLIGGFGFSTLQFYVYAFLIQKLKELFNANIE